MAKAPLYGPEKAKPSALPGVRFAAGATGESFGAGGARQIGQMGAALEQAADVTGRILLANQKKANAALANDSINKYREEVRKRLMEEVYSRTGEHALDAYKNTEKIIGEARKKYLDGLKNERQKELFAATADSDKVGHMGRSIAFQVQETKKFRSDALWAGINELHKEAMTVSRNDAGALARIEKAIAEDIAFDLSDKGVPRDKIAAAIDKDKHVLYSGVMAAIGNDSREAALEFFKKYKDKDKFDPRSDLKGMEDTLVKAAEGEWLMGTINSLVNSDMGLEEQLERVDVLATAMEKQGTPISQGGIDELKRRVKAGYGEKVALKKIRVAETIDAGYEAFAQDRDKFMLSSEFNVLPDKVQKDMHRRKQDQIKWDLFRAGRGPDPWGVTDEVWRNELMSMSRGALRNIGRENWGNLSPPAWNEVNKYMMSSEPAIRSFDMIMKDFVTRSPYLQGIRPGVIRNLNEEEINLLQSQFFAQGRLVKEIMDAKELTDEVLITKKLAELMDEQRVKPPGFGWTTTLKRFEVSYAGARETHLFKQQETEEALATLPENLQGKGVDFNYAKNVYTKWVFPYMYVWDREGKLIEQNDAPKRPVEKLHQSFESMRPFWLRESP